MKTVDFKTMFQKPSGNYNKSTNTPPKRDSQQQTWRVTQHDANISLTVELLPGDGKIIRKRLFASEEKLFNFRLNIIIKNGSKKITKLVGILKNQYGNFELGDLKTGINSFDIPDSLMINSLLMEVDVVLTYKVKLFTYKQFSLHVERDFLSDK